MIVDDLDFLGSRFIPSEYDAPLIVDANRMLAGEIASQSFQAVPRRHGELAQADGVVDLYHFTPADLGYVLWNSLRDPPLFKNQLGEPAAETPDHCPSRITR